MLLTLKPPHQRDHQQEHPPATRTRKNGQEKKRAPKWSARRPQPKKVAPTRRADADKKLHPLDAHPWGQAEIHATPLISGTLETLISGTLETLISGTLDTRKGTPKLNRDTPRN